MEASRRGREGGGSIKVLYSVHYTVDQEAYVCAERGRYESEAGMYEYSRGGI